MHAVVRVPAGRERRNHVPAAGLGFAMFTCAAPALSNTSARAAKTAVDRAMSTSGW